MGRGRLGPGVGHGCGRGAGGGGGRGAEVETERGVPGDGTVASSRPGLNPCRGCVGGGQRQLRGRGRRCPRALCKRRGRGAELERGPRERRCGLRASRGARLIFNPAVTCPPASSPAGFPEAIWNRKCQYR